MSTEPSAKMTPSRRAVLQASLAAALTAVAGSAKAATPFFKLYMMIPNNQPARMVWGTLAAAQMSRIGIDVVSSFAPFTGDRAAAREGRRQDPCRWRLGLLSRALPGTRRSSRRRTPCSAARKCRPTARISTTSTTRRSTARCDAVDSSLDEADRLKAYHDFEKRWYDIQPMTILFYPQDVVAVNPKLKGFDRHHLQPDLLSAARALDDRGRRGRRHGGLRVLAAAEPAHPDVSIGYSDSILRPRLQPLYEYKSWENKKLVPALATGHTMSADGKHWVVTLRQGVKWHSGEEFTAEDVKFTWDTMMNKAYGSQLQAICARVFGDQSAYKVTGKHEITVDLPTYSI